MCTVQMSLFDINVCIFKSDHFVRLNEFAVNRVHSIRKLRTVLLHRTKSKFKVHKKALRTNFFISHMRNLHLNEELL